MSRSRPALVVAGVLALFAFAGLVALGTWQVHRRAWKLSLIAHVEARVHSAPVTAPGPSEWTGISAAADAYRRVIIRGTFLQGRDTLVRAVTDRGVGFWVIAPLRSTRGFVVLINRGFVGSRQIAPAISGDAAISGLMRLSEPGGGFLRSNDPARDRWFSRDVRAIASARKLGPVAPYFIDADAPSSTPGGPVGGLTVISFPNNHLSYALTWYALAAIVLIGYGLMVHGAWHGHGTGAEDRD